jgi:uncharacterized DUF497 family protein
LILEFEKFFRVASILFFVYTVNMFIWDSQKAILNFEKHGVSFEEAATSFADEEGLDWEDLLHSQHELRRKRLAQSVSGRVLLTIYTIRESKNGKDKIRVISSRQANRKERQAYSG